MTTSSLRTSVAFAGLILVTMVSLGVAQAQQAQTPAPTPAPPAASPAPPAAGTPPTTTPPTDKAEPSGRKDDRASRAKERQERRERWRERERDRRKAAEWRRAMGPFAFAPLCGPRVGEAIDFYLEGIDRIVEPTDTQRGKYDDLKKAAAKAREEAAAGCNGEVAITPTGRLEAIQARLDAVLRAVRTLRPALDAFYDSLSDEQKARFNEMTSEPRRRERMERWRDRWLRH
ncbi:MAG: Spy/CpxP family protein refolding chaperone [Variibacter sp.]